MTGNVVDFPGKFKKISKSIDDIENVNEKLCQIKFAKIEDIVGFCSHEMLQNLHLAGVELGGDKESIINTAFTVENIRSLIHSHYGIGHEFQELAKDYIKINEDGVAIYDDRPVLFFGDMDD